jgi:hypothetical protein
MRELGNALPLYDIGSSTTPGLRRDSTFIPERCRPTRTKVFEGF